MRQQTVKAESKESTEHSKSGNSSEEFCPKGEEQNGMVAGRVSGVERVRLLFNFGIREIRPVPVLPGRMG